MDATLMFYLWEIAFLFLTSLFSAPVFANYKKKHSDFYKNPKFFFIFNPKDLHKIPKGFYNNPKDVLYFYKNPKDVL